MESIRKSVDLRWESGKETIALDQVNDGVEQMCNSSFWDKEP